MKQIGLLSALGAALALAACGGSNGSSATHTPTGSTQADAGAVRASSAPDGEDAVMAATQAYYSGIAEGDGSAACQHLTEDIKRAVVKGVARTAPNVKSCEDAVEQVGSSISGKGKQELTHLSEHIAVKVSGDHATVRQKDGSGSPVDLTRVGGRWLISGGLG